MNRHQLKRRFPAPPPTPQGKVIYNTRTPDGRKITEFVDIERLEDHCIDKMESYDALPKQRRDQLKGI